MFDFLKKTWQGATKRAREEEDKARASSPQSAAPGAGVVDMMPSMAGEFATKLASRGLTLDFTPASLPSVDRVLASATKELAAMPDDDRKKGQESHTCLKIAAYVGEVLRREEGGLWATGPDGLPLLDLGAHHAPVVTAVFALMTDGWIGMPDGPVDTVVAYYDHVSLEARGRLDGIVRGTHPSLESLQREMSTDSELAEWLVLKLQLAIKTAITKSNASLDFTSESLEAVEAMLTQFHDRLKTATPADRPTDKQIEDAASMWGAYVGEVVRRHYGGRWAISKPEGVLQLETEDATIFPVRKVQKRLTAGPADAIPNYFNAMRVVLESKA